MKKLFTHLIALFLCICINPPSLAAIEYLRFEGKIGSDELIYFGWDESLGFEFEQPIYFDLAFNNVKTDRSNDYEDYYDYYYLNGSYPGSLNDTLGLRPPYDLYYSYILNSIIDSSISGDYEKSANTSYFPEGTVTYFDLDGPGQSNRLLIGIPFSILDEGDGPDYGIDTWGIGDTFNLLKSYHSEEPLGHLTLTYRSEILFPGISEVAQVPTPPAVWLFSLGLLSLISIARDKINYS